MIISLNLAADPWSVSEEHPIIEERDPFLSLTLGSRMTAFWNQRFDHGYYFYQKLLGPSDGARCKMYPTCTDFAYQAIKKHGLFLGGWMATDRLMRDNGFSDSYYPLIEKFERPKLFDPVSINDFWFSSHE